MNPTLPETPDERSRYPKDSFVRSKTQSGGDVSIDSRKFGECHAVLRAGKVELRIDALRYTLKPQSTRLFIHHVTRKVVCRKKI